MASITSLIGGNIKDKEDEMEEDYNYDDESQNQPFSALSVIGSQPVANGHALPAVKPQFP